MTKQERALGLIPVPDQYLQQQAAQQAPRVFGPSQWLLDVKDGRVSLAIGSNGPGPIQGYEVRLSSEEASKLATALLEAATEAVRA